MYDNELVVMAICAPPNEKSVNVGLKKCTHIWRGDAKTRSNQWTVSEHALNGLIQPNCDIKLASPHNPDVTDSGCGWLLYKLTTNCKNKDSLLPCRSDL